MKVPLVVTNSTNCKKKTRIDYLQATVKGKWDECDEKNNFNRENNEINKS